MKIPLIHYRPEGGQLKQGLNYNIFWEEKEFAFVLKVWKLVVYLRRRGNKIWELREHKPPRYVWGIDWWQRFGLGKVTFEFDTRTLVVHDKRFSIEFLEDYLPTLFNEYEKSLKRYASKF